MIQEVPPFFSNLTLDRLQPGTEYSLRINALSETGQTNQSRLVQFVSPDNGMYSCCICFCHLIINDQLKMFGDLIFVQKNSRNTTITS